MMGVDEMTPKPLAKVHCEQCGNFLIWERAALTVIMNSRPNPPEAVCVCPHCNQEIKTYIHFKDATTFQNRGVNVVHTYDDGNDVQPLTVEDIIFLERNLDKFLMSIVEG